MNLMELFAGTLRYPDAQMPQYCDQLQECLAREAPDAATEFQMYQKAMTELTLASQCELYTRTFDLMAVCSPYAGIHLYGEDNYKRGGLMARLKEVFTMNGLEIGNELPDHVTVLLRYCTVAPAQEAQEVCEYLLRPTLESMITILSKTQNPFVHLLSALRCVVIPTAVTSSTENTGVENI